MSPLRALSISQLRSMLPLAMLALSIPAYAETSRSIDNATTGEPPERVVALVVYGDDACPKSDGDAIVVCARKPESERYRIPKDFRQKKEVVGDQNWASRVATMEQTGRVLLPNSCSAIGSNGQTGCTQAMLRQWFDERRMTQQQNAGVP